MFYLDLFRCLHAHDVRYVLVGGLAMNLHGVPHQSIDVDLVVEDEDASVMRLSGALKELQAHEGAAFQPVMRATRRPSRDFDTLRARADVRYIQNIEVPVASVRDATDTAPDGYRVTDEQLAAYAQLTPLQRLQWLDEARRFLLLALSVQARERQERLRRGSTIDAD